MAEPRHAPPDLTDVLGQIAELRAAIENLTRLMTPPPAAPAIRRTLGVAARPAARRPPIRPQVQRGDWRAERRTMGLPAGFRGVMRSR